MPPDVSSLHKVIVIRADDKLGETLLATPVYQALREALPNAWIEAWVGQRWKSVVMGSSVIDSLLGVSFRPRGLDYLRLVQRLRRIRPDALLILRPDTRRYAAIARWARVPLRVGLVEHRPSMAWLLTHRAIPPVRAHQVEWNLAVAEVLLKRSLPRYSLIYTPAAEPPLPIPLRQIPPRQYAVIHFSTGGVQPQWLPERFAQVSDWVAERYRLVPIWSAAPQDIPFAQQVATHAHCYALNLAGKVTIEQLAVILRGARLLISVDTGIVHLAAAVGTPCVSLHFRKDYPAYRWHAWQVPNCAVEPNTYCSGCTSTRCHLRLDACVHTITVEQVTEAVATLLDPLS
ncbi:MAG: glycosyl transferase family 9 [Fimbriimonadales bacterium]|nr:MAG: glycosyl transferase family 9 [Fimbriimonadales bacterium]